MNKFRVYDNRTKQILERPLIVFQDDVISVSSNENSVIDDYVLMQYTGLHDKNGKEIFEGDLVQQFDDRYEVKYDIERAGWNPFATDGGCGCCAWEIASVEYSEVIGNVHEHPHLLKEENLHE